MKRLYLPTVHMAPNYGKQVSIEDFFGLCTSVLLFFSFNYFFHFYLKDRGTER